MATWTYLIYMVRWRYYLLFLLVFALVLDSLRVWLGLSWKHFLLCVALVVVGLAAVGSWLWLLLLAQMAHPSQKQVAVSLAVAVYAPMVFWGISNYLQAEEDHE